MFNQFMKTSLFHARESCLRLSLNAISASPFKLLFGLRLGSPIHILFLSSFPASYLIPTSQPRQSVRSRWASSGYTRQNRIGAPTLSVILSPWLNRTIVARTERTTSNRPLRPLVVSSDAPRQESLMQIHDFRHGHGQGHGQGMIEVTTHCTHLCTLYAMRLWVCMYMYVCTYVL